MPKSKKSCPKVPKRKKKLPKMVPKSKRSCPKKWPRVKKVAQNGAQLNLPTWGAPTWAGGGLESGSPKRNGERAWKINKPLIRDHPKIIGLSISVFHITISIFHVISSFQLCHFSGAEIYIFWVFCGQKMTLLLLGYTQKASVLLISIVISIFHIISSF